MTPDRECDKEQIGDDESSNVGFATNAEAVTVQTFCKDEVDAVPRHQDREKTNHARDDETEFAPSVGEASVQSGDVTEQRDQRPGLLPIPTPVPSPATIRPYPARNGSGART